MCIRDRAMLVKDGFSRHAWVYFLKNKNRMKHTRLSKFLVDVRAVGVQVDIAGSDNGG